jgi:hypothetical protein
MEVFMHGFHVIALSKAKAWRDLSPYQIMMVGFFTLKHIWLKVITLLTLNHVLADDYLEIFQILGDARRH